MIAVRVDGVSVITYEEKNRTSDQPTPASKSSNVTYDRIWLEIRISNGLRLSQKNLSYQDLVRMVEKLKGLY